MELEAEVTAIRQGVALAELRHYAVLHVPGRGGLDALGRSCPVDLSLREGQMRQTLYLDEDAHPIADVYICRDEAGALLLSEGLDAVQLRELVGGWTGLAVED